MTENNSSKFKKRALALAVASCLSLASVAAQAAGLGKLTIFSGLGQPLRAEMEISAKPEELAGMTARLASADVFKQAGVEFSQVLSGLRFDVEKRAGGKSVVKLTSTRPVNDPFLDFLVELNWPTGRLIREYTFLLDPPEFAAMQGAQSSVDAKIVETVRGGGRLPDSQVPPAAPAVTARIVERSAPAENAKPKFDQSTRLVERGDTLRKIAGETQYPGVSLEQMLVGLYRNNKDAFIANDIHRLKAGAILNVPNEAAVASVSEKDARQVYLSSGDFSVYRRKLATAAASSATQDASPAAQHSAGRITPKVEEKTPGIDPLKDQVRVSRADASAKGGASGDLEKLANEKALNEAQTRLAMLEKNVGELQTLLAMKNQRLAELEKPAVASSAAPAPVAPVKAAEAVTPAVPAEPVPPAVEPKAEVSAPAPQVSEDFATKPAETPPPAKTTPKLPPPAPIEVEEPDLLETLLEDPLPLAGGAAALALLGGLLVFRRRQQDQASRGASTLPATNSLGPNSVFGSTGGQSVDTGSVPHHTGEFSQAGPGTIDTDDVDPVAEADVYMAYGRDAQAEEILLEAMLKDPNRLAIHAKLLEIYANRRSLKQFETLAAELYAQTAGLGPEWEKVALLGGEIDPANPLYGKKGAAAEAPDVSNKAFDPDATLVIRPAQAAAAMSQAAPIFASVDTSEAGASVDTSGLGDEHLTTDVLGFSSEPSQAADAKSAYQETLVSNTPLAQEFSPTAGLGELEDALSLDFDLGGSGFEPARSVEKTSASFAEAKPEPVDALSFTTPEADDASNGLDFDLSGMVSDDLSSDLGGAAVEKAEAFAVPDFSAIDLTPPVSDDSALSMDFSPEDTVVNSIVKGGGSAIDTKIDLDEMSLDTFGDMSTDSTAMEDLPFSPELTVVSGLGSSLPEISSVAPAQSPDDGLSVLVEDFPEIASVPEVDGQAMGFDLGVGAPDFTDESLPVSDFDLGAINLDLSVKPNSDLVDLPSEATELGDLASLGMPSEPAADDIVPTDFEEPAFDVPHDAQWEEVNTKLDLAKAYEEMGDLEGARELLQEVIGDGPTDLVAQAQSILGRMAG